MVLAIEDNLAAHAAMEVVAKIGAAAKTKKSQSAPTYHLKGLRTLKQFSAPPGCLAGCIRDPFGRFC